MILAASDFGSIGTALALIVIAFMQGWEKLQMKRREALSAKRDAAMEEIKQSTKKTEATVEAVHKLTNGGMGEQLMISMVSAQTLASVTKKPEHQTLAKVAQAKYKNRLEAEQKAKAAKEQKQKEVKP